MQKRKQEVILRTARYKVHNNPEKYYYSKFLLYYPWTNEEEVLTRFNSYQESYLAKQHIIHPNAQHINDDCQLFDLSPEDVENENVENEIPQSVWDLTAPSIAQDDANMSNQGYNTIQKLTEEQVSNTDRALDANNQDKCCITMVCAYHQWPVAFQQTRVPNSLPMGANYVDYEPQGTEVIQVCL